ncbi:MAG: hypothetical protein KDD70_09805 [Bdellovibrionales bacterium]|nr:hypothetical protein [Bdellovibrionales bacterium]
MRRLILDKISSSTKNVALPREVRVSDEIIAEAGYVLAGKIHGVKTTYNDVENCSGRMIRLHAGDILAGTLGHRDALKGYSGRVPKSIKVGDMLQVLNLGGVIGECTSANPQVGTPFDFEVLGSVLIFPNFESRRGEHAHVAKHGPLKASMSKEQMIASKVPVVFVAGTCMHAGKTSAAVRVVRGLKNSGKKVGACKLTGVSLLRDVLEMQDYGADWARSFVDAGVVTTDKDSAVETAYTTIGSLIADGAEVIVAELGDGILGTYGVQEILADSGLMEIASVLVLCANDPVGAWGGVQILRDDYKLQPQILCGPTTDNLAGINYIEQKLGMRAINARKDPEGLTDAVNAMIAESSSPKI